MTPDASGKTVFKKLINHPDDVASEALEGLALAFPQILRLLPGSNAVVRRDSPIAGKVAVVTGGGSGHEPMFAGFVGPGMADGSVAGNVFTSPPPQPIVLASRAVSSGSGVLFIYGNYAGDVLNFDMAADLLASEGVSVQTVRVTDDVASAPRERRHERRGIAGDFFVIKAAGAAAEEGRSLEEVAAAAARANANTASMGVALSSCVIPASGRPIFSISDEEMEVGMGLHGEPGVTRGPMLPANDVARRLVEPVVADLALRERDEVAVLVNGMGGTPLSELLIMHRAVHGILTNEGIEIARTFVGNYATSLEMAGCSVTLLRLDADLKRWLLAPCVTPAHTQQ